VPENQRAGEHGDAAPASLPWPYPATVRRRLVLAVLVLSVFAAPAAAAGVADPLPPTAGWLATLNAHRTASGLLPVTANPAWAAGLVAHSRYVVANGRPGHTEDPKLPHFSAEGALAGKNADVLSRSVRVSEREVVELFLASPFHAIGLLRPGLRQSAFGSSHDPKARTTIRFAAGIDIIRGIDPTIAITQPVLWPGPGAVVRLTRYPGSETPNPLAGCPGFTDARTGLPLVALLPEAATRVTATLRGPGAPVGLCVVTAESYRNRDPAAQALARRLLTSTNAVVLLPNRPLSPGATYAATLTTAARSISWSFRTSG
jgi:hypothetical protein